MMKAHRHLSDDQLIELCLGGAAHPVADCPSCEARRADVVALLDEVSDAAIREADAAFPADRLARQQARILQRLEQDGRPGRLITFPGHAQWFFVPPHVTTLSHGRRHSVTLAPSKRSRCLRPVRRSR